MAGFMNQRGIIYGNSRDGKATRHPAARQRGFPAIVANEADAAIAVIRSSRTRTAFPAESLVAGSWCKERIFVKQSVGER